MHAHPYARDVKLARSKLFRVQVLHDLANSKIRS